MGGRLCPICGHYAVELKPGVNGSEDQYVCAFCGAKFKLEDLAVSLNENSVQRFPTGADSEGQSNLQTFLEKKKQ